MKEGMEAECFSHASGRGRHSIIICTYIHAEGGGRTSPHLPPLFPLPLLLSPLCPSPLPFPSLFILPSSSSLSCPAPLGPWGFPHPHLASFPHPPPNARHPSSCLVSSSLDFDPCLIAFPSSFPHPRPRLSSRFGFAASAASAASSSPPRLRRAPLAMAKGPRAKAAFVVVIIVVRRCRHRGRRRRTASAASVARRCRRRRRRPCRHRRRRRRRRRAPLSPSSSSSPSCFLFLPPRLPRSSSPRWAALGRGDSRGDAPSSLLRPPPPPSSSSLPLPPTSSNSSIALLHSQTTSFLPLSRPPVRPLLLSSLSSVTPPLIPQSSILGARLSGGQARGHREGRLRDQGGAVPPEHSPRGEERSGGGAGPRKGAPRRFGKGRAGDRRWEGARAQEERRPRRGERAGLARSRAEHDGPRPRKGGGRRMGSGRRRRRQTRGRGMGRGGR